MLSMGRRLWRRGVSERGHLQRKKSRFDAIDSARRNEKQGLKVARVTL